MGRKSTPGLEWLEDNAPEQWRWAATYLAARGLLDAHDHPSNREFGMRITREDLVRVGCRHQEKRKLLQNMRAAWRQWKYRRGSKNQKTTCLFTLKPETREKLRELGEGSCESEIIERLVNKAYQSHARKMRKLSELERPQIEDHPYSLSELRTFLSGDSTPSRDPVGLKPPLADASVNAPTPKEKCPEEKTVAPPPELAIWGARDESLVQEEPLSPAPHLVSQTPPAEADELQPGKEIRIDSCTAAIGRAPELQTTPQAPARNSRPGMRFSFIPDSMRQKMQSTVTDDYAASASQQVKDTIKQMLHGSKKDSTSNCTQARETPRPQDDTPSLTPTPPSPEPD